MLYNSLPEVVGGFVYLSVPTVGTWWSQLGVMATCHCYFQWWWSEILWVTLIGLWLTLVMLDMVLLEPTEWLLSHCCCGVSLQSHWCDMYLWVYCFLAHSLHLVFEFEFTARCDGRSLSVGLQLSGKEICKAMGLVAKEVKSMTQAQILDFEKAGEARFAGHVLALQDIKAWMA